MLRLMGDRLSAKGQFLRWGILGASGLPLLGAYLYRQGAHIPLLACPLKLTTGVPCPTCGMTRSFLALAHGNVVQSATYHLFGPLLFTGFSVAVVHVLVELLTQRALPMFYLRWLRDRRYYYVLLVPFFLYYSLRLAVRFSLIDQHAKLFNTDWGQVLVAAAKML